jgi:2-polyprenyl-3-methyl-5-hydroxy-6-metoxy-1,4-benzoquinol methylase
VLFATAGVVNTTIKRGVPMVDQDKEQSKWKEVRECVDGLDRLLLGTYFSQIKIDPRRVLFALSHYKFAAKLIGPGKSVLEVGCNDGLGTLFLGESAKKVVAVDIDETAIQEAKESYENEIMEFRHLNFLNAQIGQFDAVVSLDVVEHIYPENEDTYFKTIHENLKTHGICIVGTPNKTSEKYASEPSKIGHVNLFEWDRFKAAMEKYFHNVFIFSGNDEMIHTGYYPMAHYLIGLGVGKK